MKKQGFTLMEIIVTITIIGIIVGMGVASWQNISANKNFSESIKIVEEAFLDGFITARSENREIKITKNDITLEGDVEFVKDFSIIFSAGFGDINSSSSDCVEIKNGEKSQIFKIWKKSGLIEKVSKC